MRTVVAVVFFAFGSVAVFAQQPKPPIRVYVWTAKEGLEKCVGGLTEKLDPKWLVASSKDTSEIQVEIMSLESPGAVTIGSPRAGNYSRIPIITLNATLRFNDSSAELVCTIGDKTPTWLLSAHTPTWKDAAAVCAKKAKAWVKANLRQLRPGEAPKK
jgi:hypothetical protein